MLLSDFHEKSRRTRFDRHSRSSGSTGRRFVRNQPRRSPASAIEQLETREVLNAAPYVVNIESNGMMSASGSQFDPPVVLYDVTRTHASSFAAEPISTPGIFYNVRTPIEPLGQRIHLGTDYVATTDLSFGGYAYFADDDDVIGQPETAGLRLEGGISTSAGSSSEINEDGTLAPPVLLGISAGQVQNTTTARIRIWDTDCPHPGIAVTGEWTLEGQLASIASLYEPFPGEAILEQQVTIRYWLADDDGRLSLHDTITMSNPVAVDTFLVDPFFDGQEFELTTGSEIEIEIATVASVTSTAIADVDYLQFEVQVNPIDAINLHSFQHYVTPSGAIDPGWIAIEYEVTEAYCYFDLELGAVPDGSDQVMLIEKLRIDAEVLDNDSRFRIATMAGSIESNSRFTEIGRHQLLIKSESGNLQSPFESIDTDRIVVYMPGQQSNGKSFHGFYQASESSPLVVRSDSNTADQVLLDGQSINFDYGGEVNRFSFGNETEATATPEIIVVTVGENDFVLASATFAIPVRASLGQGNDVFVGGRAADFARGGSGDDALMGEGWIADISSVHTILLDMLDLRFTLESGLIPAVGANDRLFGDVGDDFLLGGDGNDELNSGMGASIIFGDSLEATASISIDISDLSFAVDINLMRSGDGDDIIMSGDGDTLVMGGGGNDTITGNSSGISLLFGNGGNDEISGRNSFSVIAGGSGDDVIVGAGFLIGDSFSFETFSNAGISGLKQRKLNVGFELTSEDSGSDSIQGSDQFNFIVGGAGDDTIAGGSGLNIVFGDGFDLSVSIGLDFQDMFSWETFFDVLHAPLAILDLFHVDFSLKGSGDDVYNGGKGSDVVLGGAGDDELFGHAGFDFLVGGEGDDHVDAGEGFFNALSRVVSGDIAVGGPGNDVITGSNGPDFLASESGNDFFLGLEGDDVIYGGAGSDTLYGGPGNDKLYGEEDDDQLVGDDGDDELYGSLGSDTIDPGVGADLFYDNDVAPRVMAIVPSAGSPNPTTSVSLEFTVVFDSMVNGIDAEDFAVVTSGTATGTVTDVSHTVGKWSRIRVTSVTGVGTIGVGFNPLRSQSVTNSMGIVATDSFVGKVIHVGTDFAPTIVDMPEISAVYHENTPPVNVGGGMVTDGDLLDFDAGTLTVAIISNESPSDHLSVSHSGFAPGQIGVVGNSITYGIDGTPEHARPVGTFLGGLANSPLIITFENHASADDVSSVLQSVVFNTASDNPSTAARTVGFQVTDGDGGSSDVVTRTVSVVAENDAPLLTMSRSVVEYIEGSNPVSIDAHASVFDTDSDDFEGGTLTIAIADGVEPTDRLTIEASGRIAVNTELAEVYYDGDVIGVYSGDVILQIALTAKATQAAVTELLRHISFASLSEAPSPLSRNITFMLTDGDGGTSVASLSSAVMVIPINDPPLGIKLSNSSVLEHRPIGTIVGILSTNDPEAAAGDSFSYMFVETELFPDNGHFSIDLDGALRTADIFDFATRDTYAVRIRTTDVAGGFIEDTLVIAIIDADRPPSDIQLGTTVSGEIIAAGDKHLYRITLPESATLYFDSLGDTNYLWAVAGPSGFVAGQGSGGDYAFVAPEVGQYTVSIEMIDDSTGPFAFRVLDLALATPLTLESTVNGTLDPASATNAYRFNAHAGDQIVFDTHTDTPQNASWQLLDPFGHWVASGWIGIDGEIPTLTASGNYTLLIEGLYTDSGSTEYSFTIAFSTVVFTRGDFHEDSQLNCNDIDLLVVAVAGLSDNLFFDINGDHLLSFDDILDWLTIAGTADPLVGAAYLPGDANLDGAVDGLDFDVWNQHQFTTTAAWCSADFNADGVTDGSDFTVWNRYKFQSGQLPSGTTPQQLVGKRTPRAPRDSGLALGDRAAEIVSTVRHRGMRLEGDPGGKVETPKPAIADDRPNAWMSTNVIRMARNNTYLRRVISRWERNACANHLIKFVDDYFARTEDKSI